MSSSSPETSMATLSLSFPDHSTRLALSIPVSQVKDYAENPLRWLRYLGITITGQTGRLSTSSAGPEIDDYDAEIEARGYFFILDGEPCFVDASMMDDRISAVSGTQNQRAPNFRKRILDRDGTCIATGEVETHCIAAHIVPHAKGSQYMQILSNLRGGAYSPPEILNDIDDTCNGILLENHVHGVFGKAEGAFLKTPNFGLFCEDIPSRPGDSNHWENRLTLQYFPGAQVGVMLPQSVPHNSDVRQPTDTNNWPPRMLFDTSYAVGALKAWGSDNFMEYIKSQTHHIYYPRDDNPL